MANFKLQKNGYLYLIHWITSDRPLKISTGIKLKPEQWNENAQQLTDSNLKDENGVRLADTIAKYKGAMASALQEIKVTKNELKPTFYSHLKGEIIRGNGSTRNEIMFLEYFDQKVKEFEADKKSNYKSYKTTYRNLVQFFGKRRPAFRDIDSTFYDDFKRFLEKTKDYKKNTVGCQIKNIKSVVGEAYKKKIHSNGEFKEFKIAREPAVNVFLTLAELDKIYNLNFKNHPAIDRTRDSFIVASFTGLRFEDWGRVRADYIKDGILRIQATKTNEVSQIPVHKYVKAILEKHKGVMPEQISNQKTNDNIKVICKCARLNQAVEKPYTKGGKRSSKPKVFKKWQMCSTHTARRSLCTNLILQGASPFIVMKISGHRNFESFQKYIKLDEILALDNLKSLPMFQEKATPKPPRPKKVQPEVDLSIPAYSRL